MSWIPLQSEEHLAEIVARSRNADKPIVIFKHSTRCGISAEAKSRVEASTAFIKDSFETYFLDLLAYRAISNKIADMFQVKHESPQLLFIKDAECVYEVSHGSISERSFEKVMNFI